MDCAIGIDLGGTSVKSVVVTPEGRLLDRNNTSFDDDSSMDWARSIRNLVQGMVASHGDGSSPRIGVSAPGLASRDARSISHMPGRLGGLEGLVWSDFLQSRTPVPVLNDAQAALVGEAWLGAARGFDNVIMLTLGTGVGGAAMVDGRLLRGEIGRAGHLGHASLDTRGEPDICGMPGSLEVCIGNCTVAQRSNGRHPTTHALVAAHLAGDSEATDVWLRSVHQLACAIGSFINILDPAAVVIGGGIAQAGPALFEPLQQHLEQVEWRPGGHRVQILPAALGEFAGAFGAARNALLS